ncbi:hypothetical protein [Chrysiogenes arsenatis]|uniref:hypothetical protein n=1 Tax=Chrysiogenes arsenatis TaxID=309797 RepID=UPI0004804921|nr:hypothetical protein [Chrysiogenes arsenatis]
MQRERIYRVLLDSEWQLDDLYEFPQAFAKSYAFIYCLDSELAPRDRDRINRALAEYPWRGGFSYVNINTVLHNQVPIHDRPRIRSIQYASPGWLDLFLNVDVAIQVAKSVGVLLGAAGSAALTYKGIYKTLASIKVEREKAKLQTLQLTQAQAKVVLSLCDDMAKFLGFKNVKELHQFTGNPETSMKLLAAHYRRTKTLTEFVENGKAELPSAEYDNG